MCASARTPRTLPAEAPIALLEAIPAEVADRSRSGRAEVVFYLAGEANLDLVRRLDPDRDLHGFRRGERSWVAQTFLRLRAAGYPVEIAGRPVSGGLIVFHAKHKHALARAARGLDGAAFVGIRADNSSPLLADFEILQNGRYADGRRRFALPFWPQPGLLPRDPARGTRVERVGYMGLVENLAAEFRDDAWRRRLSEVGLIWVATPVDYAGTLQPKNVDWENYNEVDAVLAVRPRDRRTAFTKPASKLINAWRAGVPALVGPEFPFRELRRSELDYLEVDGPDAAVEALLRLRSDPELYSLMVENGRRRAQEFSYQSILDRWAELLFDTLPARIRDGALPWSRKLPVPLRLGWRRVERWVTGGKAR